MTILLGLALAAMLPPNSPIDPIDTFESGDFSFTASSYEEHLVDIEDGGWHVAHAIAPQRRVILAPSPSTTVSASRGPGLAYPFDGSAIVEVSSTSWCAFEYELGTMDLTETGMHSHIDLDFELAPIGGDVTVTIHDAMGSEGITRAMNGAAQLVTWDLSEWSSVDVTQATKISIRFDAAEVAYRLTSARLRRTEALAVEIHPEILFTEIPPLPSGPLQFEVWERDGGPLFEAGVSLVDVDAGFVPEMHVDLLTAERLGGDFAVMDVEWDDDAPFAPTSVRLRVAVAPANGYLPEIYPPDPIAPGPGILLAFPVRLDEGLGGNSETLLLIEPVGPQRMTFENVAVVHARRAWGASFDVLFDVLPIEVDDQLTLFRLTWVGDHLPASAVDVPGELPTPEQRDALRAVPSITAGGTTLRAIRPFALGERVRVHDLLGRVVRELHPAVGSRALQWDGRDGFGRKTPPGVYFLHRSGGVAARVVSVR